MCTSRQPRRGRRAPHWWPSAGSCLCRAGCTSGRAPSESQLASLQIWDYTLEREILLNLVVDKGLGAIKDDCPLLADHAVKQCDAVVGAGVLLVRLGREVEAELPEVAPLGVLDDFAYVFDL